jgi:dephospho-CoA kinase
VALHVGLTGGIGCGKSTVAGIFQVLGIPVLNADAVAKNLMNTDPSIRAAIQQVFGMDMYSHGQLERKKLAALVFSNPDLLAQLNAIVHPASIAAAITWANQQTTPYCVKEAALFFESASAEGIDVMVGVSSPKALRIQRVMQRDQITRDEVIQRMQNQIDENLKMRLCDEVVVNNNIDLLIPQVLALHEKLLQKAAEKKLASLVS